MTEKRLREGMILLLSCVLIAIHAIVLTASNETTGSDKTLSPDQSQSSDVIHGNPLIRVVVGHDKEWRRGRVEESQLLASAKLHNYNVKIQNDDDIPCDTEEDKEGGDIIVFFPRAEGILAVSPESLASSFEKLSAKIVVPQGNVNALIGYSKSIQSSAKLLGVSSLTSLAFQLRRSSKGREDHNAKVDADGKIFHVLDDASSISNDDLNPVPSEGRFDLSIEGQSPCIWLASPESARGRSLLLAASDYLIGTHHPEEGCVSCYTSDNEPSLNVSHTVMVGLFITRPQPFLEEVFGGLIRNGGVHELLAKNVHFFIYNQVEEYKRRVEIFVERLEEFSEVRNYTLVQASGINPDVAYFKNMALKECLRINCKWYVNVDSYSFLNPDSIPLLMSVNHPVISPSMRVQKWMPSTFWREMDSVTSKPAYSWDHSVILTDALNMRNYWHASCIRGFYAIRHDVLEGLTDPYTYSSVFKQESKTPQDPSHDTSRPTEADLAFCAALRDNGIPMVATNAFQNIGLLINITKNYKIKENNLDQYESNPVMWTISYGNQHLQNILAGDLESIKRPCHEVYDVPAFNPLFAYDLVRLANRVNRWSPALKKDPRKRFGIEPVPTVDQLLSQLGVDKLFDLVYKGMLMQLQAACFPAANPSNVTQSSLIARFKPDELPGLPQHHDSAIMTMYINLTPKDEYQGGEVEFPLQDCRVRPEVGHVLMFPSRLTHPKVLHNVTEGVLHKAMIYIDDTPLDEDDDEDEKSPLTKKQ